jgi:hypothetical protein
VPTTWSDETTNVALYRLAAATYPEFCFERRFHTAWLHLYDSANENRAWGDFAYGRLKLDNRLCVEEALQKARPPETTTPESALATSPIPASIVDIELDLRQPHWATDFEYGCYLFSGNIEQCQSKYDTESKLGCQSTRECVPNRRGFACFCTGFNRLVV